MKFSVVVCTKNRSSALAACLYKIFEIDFSGEWEVIVVNNGSSDDTSDVIRVLAKDCPVPFHQVEEFRPGNSWGRNSGLNVATGEVIFFTDDDCFVDSGLLTALDGLYADRSIGYVAGRILLANPNDYLCCYLDLPQRQIFQAGSLVFPGMVQGSNMSFRRSVLDLVGGFDPLFGAGAKFAGEDLDLAMRVGLAGWKGVYDPEPLVLHNHGRSQADYERMERFYDFGAGAYYLKSVKLSGYRKNIIFSLLSLFLRITFDSPFRTVQHIRGALAYRAAIEA